MRHRITLAAAALAVVSLVAVPVALSHAPTPADAAEARHLRLVRSTPAADAAITQSPPEIRLVFSEPPQMRGTSVRLTRGTDDLVAATDAAADPADARQVFIRPEAGLAPGAYTVHWRVIAQDGHTQRGTFGFQVRAAE